MNKTFLYIALAALLAASCTSKTADADHHDYDDKPHADDIVLTSRQMEAVDIALGQVAMKNLSDIVRVNGSTALNPQDRADVAPLVGGIVSAIAVIEGSRVAKGQTVAWVENTDIVALQKDYLQSRGTLSQAERELARQRELEASGAGVERNLQQAEANYQEARLNVMALGRQLRQLGIAESDVRSGNIATRIPIKSPIGGFVDKIYKSTGSYADMQQPVMSVVDDSKMHIDINVYERDMARLATGQQVDFVLTNNPAVRMKGEIYEFASTFTDKAKSLIAHVKITDRGTAAKLIPGMYVTGSVERGRADVLAVPSKAIASSEGKDYVFVLEKTVGDEHHFNRVEVVAGAEELGYTQITPTTQLKTSDTIVVAGAFYLSSMLGEEAEHGH